LTRAAASRCWWGRAWWQKRRRWVDPSGPVVGRVIGGGGPIGLAGLELVRADVRSVEALGAKFRCEGTAMAVKPPAVGYETGSWGCLFSVRVG
jgi:hypothetical protein